MRAGERFGDPALPMILIERSVRRAILDVAVASDRRRLDDLAAAAARLHQLATTAEQLAAQEIGEAARQIERVRTQAAAWLPLGWMVVAAPKAPGRHRACAADVAEREFEPVDATAAELAILDLDCLDLARICLRDARLFDITGRRARFDDIDAASACLFECRFFSSSFRRGSFEDAVLVDCDLSGTDLAETRWAGARLSGCTFLAAQFTDASLDGATFTDCDLRASAFDIVVPRAASSARSACFVRCDLRETKWSPGQKAVMSFIECKLDDTRHSSAEGGNQIEKQGVSPAGDGGKSAPQHLLLGARRRPD